MPDFSAQQNEDDVAVLMEMAPDFASVCCSSAQTAASTFCYDTRDQPIKFADSATIQKTLRRAASHDPIRAAKGCEEAAWFALEETNRATIGAEQGVDTLLCCLQRWMGKKSLIIISCLNALRHLLSDEQNADAFYAFTSPLLDQMQKDRGYAGGGTILIAAAMSGYPLKTDIQMHGCAVANTLARDPTSRLRFIRNGMVGHVLAAMHRHPDSAPLCVSGLSCFNELAEDAATREWLVMEGVVLDYVAEALQTHICNTEVAGCAVSFISKVQDVAALIPEVRKSTAVVSMLQCCETHGANGELSGKLIAALLPHVGEYPSRLDEFACCVKKVMSSHADPELLALCCIMAARLAKCAPSDAAKLRISRHLVPYASAALHTFEGVDPVVARCASHALAALVINKWDTDLGKPRKARRAKAPAAACIASDSAAPSGVGVEAAAAEVGPSQKEAVPKEPTAAAQCGGEDATGAAAATCCPQPAAPASVAGGGGGVGACGEVGGGGGGVVHADPVRMVETA